MAIAVTVEKIMLKHVRGVTQNIQLHAAHGIIQKMANKFILWDLWGSEKKEEKDGL